MSSSNITVSICIFTLKTSVKYSNIKFVPWKMLGNKPTHHTPTETLGITISKRFKVIMH
jgi:hypothetical protein